MNDPESTKPESSPFVAKSLNLNQEIVTAELVVNAQDHISISKVMVPGSPTDATNHMSLYLAPPNAPRVTEIGGAVASCVLGAWSIVCCFLTPFSSINGLMGVAFGIWGLRSPRKKMATLGIVLSVIGIALSWLGGFSNLFRPILPETPNSETDSPPAAAGIDTLETFWT